MWRAIFIAIAAVFFSVAGASANVVPSPEVSVRLARAPAASEGVKLAFWQSRDSNYNVSVVLAPTTPPTITFVSLATGATGSGTTTFTWSSANIGTTSGFTSRRIIAIMPNGSAAGRLLSSATINGVSADSIVNMNTNTNGGELNLASAVVPSGTTGVTIVFTFNNTQFGASNLAIFSIDDALLTTGGANHAPTTSAAAEISSGTSVTATLNTSSGMAVIGYGSSVSVTDTGFSTNTLGISNDSSNASYVIGHANNVGAFTPASLTNTVASSGAAAAGLLAYK